MMRKLAYAALCALLLCGLTLGLSACGGGNTLVCGVTPFEPMNFQDESGNWTGFDTEFAQLVGQKLNIPVEFQEIQWDAKYAELESGAINCIWNGFTANANESDGTPRRDFVDFSYSYMLNQQCVVVRADRAAEFTSEASLDGRTVAAEAGSAGASFAEGAVGGGLLVGVTAQIDTFREVKAGAVDCAVVDILLAQQITGQADYSDLQIAAIELPSEVYAIGFKKGDALRDRVNAAMKELYDAGELQRLAEKYGLQNSLLLDTTFAG